MTCPICSRGTQESYCDFHRMAHDNLTKAYVEWRDAMNITWEEYLKIVADNPNTGQWAIEVARDLLGKGVERPAI